MAETIRVLEIIMSFNIEREGGGESRFVTELIKATDRNKYEIAICGLWEIGTSQERERMHVLQELGILTFNAAQWDERHPYLSMWHAMVGLRTIVHNHPVDIIHVHSVFAEIAILPLSIFRHNRKMMQTLHLSPWYGWTKRSIRRFILSQLVLPLVIDMEIGVSQEIVDYLNRRFISRLFRKKARLVHNTINLDRFKGVTINITNKRLSLGIPDGAIVVGSIGRLAEEKGWAYLLDAALLVLEQMPQVFFLIIGDGKLANQLKSWAAKKNIISHVIFTGSRPDIEELLSCMDLFVSSSLLEGLPTVILESMAAGIPVVATDIPGTRELIHDQQNGWLVPPANATALAQAILIALKDAESRRQYSKLLMKDVQSFSIKSAVAAYETIYSEVFHSNQR